MQTLSSLYQIHYIKQMRRVNKYSRKKTDAHQHYRHGRRLRNLRTARKLTLDQLSRMAGVSKAMLSQIEQDKVNPTIAVMLKICNALKISISELLDSPQHRNIIKMISSSDKAYTFRSDKSCNIRTLSPLGLEKAIEFYRITLEANGKLVSEPHFPGTEEILYLAKGRLAIASGEQQAEINKGDSIHYRADLLHSLRNTGRGQAEAYIIVRYREE